MDRLLIEDQAALRELYRGNFLSRRQNVAGGVEVPVSTEQSFVVTSRAYLKVSMKTSKMYIVGSGLDIYVWFCSCLPLLKLATYILVRAQFPLRMLLENRMEPIPAKEGSR